MRNMIMFIASAAATALAPEPDPRAFDQALTDFRWEDAGRELDALMTARSPADGRPAVDSLVAARTGRFLQASFQTGAALAHFRTVDYSKLGAADQVSTMLAYGASLEAFGERRAALSQYEQAQTRTTQGSAEWRRALLGRARMTLVADPAAVSAMLAPIAGPGADWQVLALVAAAASLSGDRIRAEQDLARAWTAAADRKPEEGAPTIVATLRAGVAAAHRDRLTERSMLAAANASLIRPGPSVTVRLPVCGDDGVTPADWIMMGVVEAPIGPTRLIPVAASRVAIIPAFYDRLAGTVVTEERGDDAFAGTVMALRCVSSISNSYAPKISNPDPLVGWMAERGLYFMVPSKPGEDPAEVVNELSRRIEAIETKFGKQSTLLLPLRLQLLSGLAELRATGMDVPSGRLSDLNRDIISGLQSANAPELAELFGLRTELEQIALSASQGRVDLTGLAKSTERLLMLLPAQHGLQWMQAAFQNAPPETLAIRRRLIASFIDRKSAALDPRARQALFSRLAAYEKETGTPDAAKATLAKAGFDASLCRSADGDPQLVEQKFSSSDYPPDILRSSLTGVTAYELVIGADGSVNQPRPIMSVPAGLFDEISQTKLTEMKFSPAQRRGKPVRCTGFMQRVVWRFPSSQEFEIPAFNRPTPNEGS